MIRNGLEPPLPDREAEYRRRFLRGDAVQASAALVVWNVLSVLSLRADYLTFGAGQSFYALLAGRAALLLLGVLAVLYLSRNTSPALYDRIVLAALAAIALFTLAVNLSRPNGDAWRPLLDVTLIFALYVAAPAPLPMRASPALLFTIVSALSAASRAEAPGSASGLLVAYGAANVLGLLASIQFHRLRRRLFQAHEQAEAAQEELRRLATTDVLTGVANRRELIQRGLEEYGRAQRYDRPFAILVMDIDGFKHINDRYGHAAGDAVLQQFAQQVMSRKRRQDIFGRLGGQEFALLLPETRLSDAITVAERLRQMCAETAYTVPEGEAHITLSLGLVERTEADGAFESLRRRADDTLYKAKQKGPNCLLWA